MSLKHKNTSKWAKKQNSYAKYNDKARELVHEQLDLSKQLTKKRNPLQSMASDDEDTPNIVIWLMVNVTATLCEVIGSVDVDETRTLPV